MGEDASLETFASDIDLATTTYAWSADGAACESCGELGTRRWQQDGELVCPACKEWDGE